MTLEMREKMKERMMELKRAGVKECSIQISSMGCCGRTDGSYRCTSK